MPYFDDTDNEPDDGKPLDLREVRKLIRALQERFRCGPTRRTSATRTHSTTKRAALSASIAGG